MGAIDSDATTRARAVDATIDSDAIDSDFISLILFLCGLASETHDFSRFVQFFLSGYLCSLLTLSFSYICLRN